MFFTPSGAPSIDELLQRLRRIARQREFAHGLLPAQWDVLRYLARANAMSRTPGGLATFLGTTRGTVSQTLMALEAKGCIARVRTERDRRVVQLELTEAGRALLEQDPQLMIRQAVDDLPREISGMMARGLRALVDRVDRTALQSFGTCQSCRHHCGEGAASQHCRLTGDTLAAMEMTQICVNHAPLRASA